MLIELRTQQLEDNILQDLELLKGYEDELRYETDPSLRGKYRLRIERQRESYTRNRQEYDELQKVPSILDGMEVHRVPESELQEALSAVQQALSEIKQNKTGRYDPQLVSEAKNLSEVVDDPKLDAHHKLKVSVPIIPLILSYETELELKSGLNLKAAWQGLKARVRGEG
jgi:septation ring formation regulator EzrA